MVNVSNTMSSIEIATSDRMWYKLSIGAHGKCVEYNEQHRNCYV